MNIKEFSDKLFTKGYEMGFEDMEVYYTCSDSFDVKVYSGEIDSYNVNASKGLSFRGSINGKIAYSFTERFESEDIDYLLNSAITNSEEIEIVGEEFIYEGSESYHPPFENKYTEIEASKKIEDAINLEKKAYSIDDRIESVQHCIIQTAKGSRRIINTKGLDLNEESGISMAYLSLVAGDGGAKKSGSSFEMTSSYSDIDFDKISKEASSEAISKIGAIVPKTDKYKIILRYDVAADMLSTFSGIFSAESVQKGLSLLKGKLGEMIAAPIVSIIDDPFLGESSTNCTFDDEGVATFKKPLIDKGKLTTYLHNLKTSKKDGVESTGNGFKASYKSPVDISPTNLYINKGEMSLDEIIKSLDKGIMITELQGLHSGANSVSGDFSLAALGQLIENGKITCPVEQITISGNFYDLIKNVIQVASDFKLSSPSGAGGFGSPSLLIKEMNISGN